MYTKLTKVANVNGVECITCAFYGTEKCLIHSDETTPNCAQCKVMCAILNQLHAFEEIICDEEQEKGL